MRKYIALFENWSSRKDIVTLTSRQGRKIIVTFEHGTIQEISNESGIVFPYVTGQPFTIWMKGWACRNGFTWNGEDPCDSGEEKIFGIKKKFIPKGHEWRQIFPGKFKK